MKAFLEKMSNHIYDNSPKKENVVKLLSGVSLVYGLSLLYYHRQAIGHSVSDILSSFKNNEDKEVSQSRNEDSQNIKKVNNLDTKPLNNDSKDKSTIDDDEKSINQDSDNDESNSENYVDANDKDQNDTIL